MAARSASRLVNPDYHVRRLRAVDALDALPRGSRTRLAFDCEIAPSIVSSILTGGYENPRHLALIESWIAEQPALVSLS
jgi:hypothetical protein